MRAAILAIQQYGVEKIVVAAPVAPAAVIADLEEEAEEVVCIAHLAPSRRMSDCYESFPRLSDDGIMDVLISANPQIAGKPLPAAVDQAS